MKLDEKRLSEIRAEAGRQVRYGADGAKVVPAWGRLNAYWWVTKEKGAVDRMLVDGLRKSTVWPTFAREVFARLHSGDRLADVAEAAPEFAFARKLHKAIEQLPEWQRLAKRCRGRSYESEAGAYRLARAMAKQLAEQPDVKGARQRAGLLRDDFEAARADDPTLLEPPPLVEAERELAEREAEAEQLARDLRPSAVRQAARQAIARAGEDLDDLSKASCALGWSADESGEPAQVAAARKEAIAEQLAASPRLREILELVGRMRNIMRECQATKVRRGVSEVTDIEAGRDLARLLPSELLQLKNPLTRLVLARKLTEGSALQYRLEAEEPVAKGPVVVAIDDSGSMGGAPEVWSKAIALALLDLARREGRPFAFCLFSQRLVVDFVEQPGKRTAPESVLQMLAIHAGGGTDFDPPINWACDVVGRYPHLRDADLVFITDGECRASAATCKRLAALPMQCHGVAVGAALSSQRGPGSLADFCDRLLTAQDFVPARDNHSEIQATRAVLSI
jgi:hypothetical protein